MKWQPNSNQISLFSLIFATVALAFGFAVWVLSDVAVPTTPSHASTLAQATAVVSNTVPVAVGSAIIQPIGTAQGPVETVSPKDALATIEAAVTQAAATTQAQTSGNNNNGNNSGSGTSPAGTTTPGNSFPWLPVAIVALVLAALAFFFARQRRTTVAVAPGPAPAATTTTSTTSTAMLYTAGAATMPVATGVPSSLPETVDCPNCGTTNQFSENFCHECGQDLRPIHAQMIAAATPPPEMVTDDMPYLETLDRTDEQLEYVLSRPMIALGTAPSNDIVIDSAFKGAESVSPVHAELRREQDGFMIMDRGSQNGTLVNEMRTGENLLKDGDVVRLGVGGPRFVFRVPTIAT